MQWLFASSCYSYSRGRSPRMGHKWFHERCFIIQALHWCSLQSKQLSRARDCGSFVWSCYWMGSSKRINPRSWQHCSTVCFDGRDKEGCMAQMWWRDRAFRWQVSCVFGYQTCTQCFSWCMCCIGATRPTIVVINPSAYIVCNKTT